MQWTNRTHKENHTFANYLVSEKIFKTGKNIIQVKQIEKEDGGFLLYNLHDGGVSL